MWEAAGKVETYIIDKSDVPISHKYNLKHTGPSMYYHCYETGKYVTKTIAPR